jgi:hypothetical protein
MISGVMIDKGILKNATHGKYRLLNCQDGLPGYRTSVSAEISVSPDNLLAYSMTAFREITELEKV